MSTGQSGKEAGRFGEFGAFQPVVGWWLLMSLGQLAGTWMGSKGPCPLNVGIVGSNRWLPLSITEEPTQRVVVIVSASLG